MRRKQHRLGFLQPHQLVGVRRGDVLKSSASAATRSKRRLQPVFALQDAGVVGKHHRLKVAQDAVGFRRRRGVQRRAGFPRAARGLRRRRATGGGSRSRSSIADLPAIQPLPTQSPMWKPAK